MDAVIALARGKGQAWIADKLRDNHAVQNVVGYWDATLKTVRAGLPSVLDEVRADADRAGALSADNRIATGRRRPTPFTGRATRRTTPSTRPARRRSSPTGRSNGVCGT